MIDDAGYKWTYAWDIEDAFPLDTPVPYTRKNGQVIWVGLNEDDVAALTKECEKTLDRFSRTLLKTPHRKRFMRIKKELGFRP